MPHSRLTTGLAALIVATAGLLTSGAHAEDYGTLTGRLVYDGKAPKPAKINANKDPEVCGKSDLHEEDLIVADDGGLRDAILYLRTEKVTPAPSYEADAKNEVLLNNKGCRFEPHVVLLRTSQTLAIGNGDPVGHNSKVDALKNDSINPIIPAGEKFTQQFPKEENLPLKVGCNIHPWMHALVLVRDSPYMAVTDKEGNFEIKDLPVGKDLEFVLWHEKAGYMKDVKLDGSKTDSKGRIKLKIKAGENKLGDIKVSPKTFK